MSYKNTAYSITSKSNYKKQSSTSKEEIGFRLDPKEEKRIMDEWIAKRKAERKLKKQNKG